MNSTSTGPITFGRISANSTYDVRSLRSRAADTYSMLRSCSTAARTVRAAVLTEREQEYVSAARLRNERTPYILFGEILPNVMGPIIVEFTVRLGYAIFVAAGLSFLGFGIQPPAPDWGLQVAENYGVISGGFWWPVLFPSVAIATLVIGVNLIADGVASAFER